MEAGGGTTVCFLKIARGGEMPVLESWRSSTPNRDGSGTARDDALSEAGWRAAWRLAGFSRRVRWRKRFPAQGRRRRSGRNQTWRKAATGTPKSECPG